MPVRAGCNTLYVLSISLAACAASHSGLDGTAGMDAGTDPPGAFDAAGLPPDADCGLVGGYRRCDERCPVPCGDGAFCSGRTGICLSIREEVADYCAFSFGERGARCWTGLPCATTGAPCGGGDHEICGDCVSVEYCLTAAEAGLPPTRCVWSDGSELVRGPPRVPCAESPDDRQPFCGGSCGIVRCPDLPVFPFSGPPIACVGVSDDRGLGVCSIDNLGCGPPPRSVWVLPACEAELGAPCACLLTLPQPRVITDGWLALRSVCLAYRDLHPDRVECRDESGAVIP